MMKGISKEANLSKPDTNHCIRATTSTVLYQAGMLMERITGITGVMIPQFMLQASNL